MISMISFSSKLAQMILQNTKHLSFFPLNWADKNQMESKSSFVMGGEVLVGLAGLPLEYAYEDCLRY